MKHNKRTPVQLRLRKAQADFLRWGRTNPDRVWFTRGQEGRFVCFVLDAQPSQLNGHATTYLYSQAGLGEGFTGYRHLHETGPSDVSIIPLRRAQFWQYLHKHCAVAQVA